MKLAGGFLRELFKEGDAFSVLEVAEGGDGNNTEMLGFGLVRCRQRTNFGQGFGEDETGTGLNTGLSDKEMSVLFTEGGESDCSDFPNRRFIGCLALVIRCGNEGKGPYGAYPNHFLIAFSGLEKSSENGRVGFVFEALIQVLNTVVAPFGSFLLIPEHCGKVRDKAGVATFTEFVGNIVAKGFVLITGLEELGQRSRDFGGLLSGKAVYRPHTLGSIAGCIENVR